MHSPAFFFSSPSPSCRSDSDNNFTKCEILFHLAKLNDFKSFSISIQYNTKHPSCYYGRSSNIWFCAFAQHTFENSPTPPTHISYHNALQDVILMYVHTTFLLCYLCHMCSAVNKFIFVRENRSKKTNEIYISICSLF